MTRIQFSFAFIALMTLGAPISHAVESQTEGAPMKASAKALVDAHCSSCHGSSQITRSLGYSAEHWAELIDTMVDLSAVPQHREQIVDYLASNYPPNTRRAPKLIDGDLAIEFKEWIVPTLGQRARDPVESPNGEIWWAGQTRNLIGRINPQTGAMREYALPANAMPHTVTPDKNGMIWYAGNRNGTVGMLNPDTGKITEYPMPDPAARDPHTMEFDQHGMLWFTLQQSNMIGRLNPQSGAITLVSIDRRGARPYGIKIAADGNPWVACNGSNCLIEVDAQSMALNLIELPGNDTTVRRLDITSDGQIWYVNSGRGRLGRYTPTTGAIKEWPSPSGPESHPYAIAVVDDIVWYNESAKRPDALVRFDPKTESFQSWAVPSGNFYAGIIRHMRPDRAGNLLIHQGSSNRIILVKIPATDSQSN